MTEFGCALINTPLQRGVTVSNSEGNRFQRFPGGLNWRTWDETVENGFMDVGSMERPAEAGC